ncbi:MAG TPA: LON peptidase substrate-binding domain-containing protein [Intrasporangium sp.]|uniref:LON peptidase substrate-binding domain-containing protein n=1 Tax=Intrasporangium sp. TaxID=1925024 RepID=UPI002D7737DD|nr:LON peptidase substrate-binding domain-containing protein [Intrasporangium sp.]HET7397201.1 LON peptidase substrate-binding domain-containing protein [Intrasporangium sp.]
MTTLPIFPLGSVLLPAMPMALRIFEHRYVVLLSRVLREEGEFGVVLIERGSEVGGGDHRFGLGTVARIRECDVGVEAIHLVAVGGRRFEVREWLEDDPHPEARVSFLPDLQWSPHLRPLLDEAEVAVRRGLARASEFTGGTWPAGVGLSDDPLQAAWQLAGISPVGPLDRQSLLRAATVEELLTSVIQRTEEAVEVLTMAWPEDPGDPSGRPD